MSNELKRAFVNYGFFVGGFTIGAIVCGLDGSPHQSWISISLMAIGGIVCARVAMR